MEEFMLFLKGSCTVLSNRKNVLFIKHSHAIDYMNFIFPDDANRCECAAQCKTPGTAMQVEGTG
jgi:hypothetical protein